MVRGAYIITAFGGLVTLKLIDTTFELGMDFLWYFGMVFSVLGAIYTAFLFAQARARDLWQSKWTSALHMLIHAIMAGTIVMMFVDILLVDKIVDILLWCIVINLVIIAKEIFFPHNFSDTKQAITLMTKGYYSRYFWTGIVLGNLIPLSMLLISPDIIICLVAAALATIGIFLTELVRIRIPQMIPLS